MDGWVTAHDIETALGVSRPTARNRAECEGWETRTAPGRGGLRKEYRYESLPDEVRQKLAAGGVGEAIETLPDIVPTSVSVFGGAKSAERSQVEDYNRRVGDYRAWILSAWRGSRKTVAAFERDYNAGDIEVPKNVREYYGRVTASSLTRWAKVRDAGGTLCPNYGTKPRGNAQGLTAEQADIFLALYLNQNKRTISFCYREVAKHYGPVRADYSSVTRLVKQIPEAVLVRFRDGFDRYNARCLPAMRRNYYRYRPNQIWVIDHHVLDMVTIHNGKLYRPWLTAIADLRSRKVMGWCLSYNPCTLTILEALGMAIEANGNRAPQTMLLDNGKDMRSFLLNGRGQWIPSQADGMTEAEMVHFSGAFEQLGIEVQFSQPYHGQSKPIERWFRTLIEEFVKGFGTYVGSNTTSKPEESKLFWRALNGSRKKTVHVTIDLVRETAAWWIPEWNNTWKHRGHGMEGRTPEAVWKIDQIQNPVILDSSLSLILETEQTMCTVYKNGIKIDKIEYYAPELMEYQGQKVRVRRLFKDMSRVLVYKLAGDTYICEAAADALMETGVTKDDVASVKRAHKAVRKLEDQYREAMERGNSHLSHQEQLILIAEKRTSAGGGNRTDVEERKVSGNPIPFPRPSKLKTGNPILDRQPE